MFYKKSTPPEIGELVLCTVKRILYHSVFVGLDEYEGKEGMIHISEIAPGRIRNLRDYVKEGKRVVCKVLDINPQTKNIDLSLRRVGTGQMVQKINLYKQEEKAEKLLQLAAKEAGLTLQQAYLGFGTPAIVKYGSLHIGFQHIVADGKKAVEDFPASASFKDILVKTIQEKIKPVEISVTGILSLKTTKPNGIDDVKEILLDLEKAHAHVSYLGAPKYKITVISTDYKLAENQLKNLSEKAINLIKKKGGEGEFLKSAS
ncbi:translation initiation factor IF-2 subunit alpha [Candidatus Woesearchaeota archaeon]|nr:translation initiation factor IF-2 subunit alpha [Candidatus Woesearchaeota archaeon]